MLDIFFLKQIVFRPKAYRIFRTLLYNQILPVDQLWEINWHKRKNLLAHAYNTVPFYRETYQSLGITPQDIKNPEDWEILPVVKRTDIASAFNKFKSSHYSKRNSAISSTGGSTGNPIKVLHDRRYPYEALGWRMMSWWGISPGADTAFVRLLVRTKKLDISINNLIWLPTKRIWLDAASISPSQMDIFIQKYNQQKPQLLQGNTGNIHYLALYIDKNSIPVHHPKGVSVTSCPISSVERSLIHKVFSAPVYDQYGCGEVYWIAAQCKEKGGLHINSDTRYIEFMNENGKQCMPGTPGKIIITDLENYIFPLIRYENGDIGQAIQDPCACGITLPLMEPVKGRINDLIRLPDGVVISGLTKLFDDFPEAVHQFQIIQSRDYSIMINIVPNYEYINYEYICNIVKQKLDLSVKGKVRTEINLVNEIRSDRGKLRFIISDIQ